MGHQRRSQFLAAADARLPQAVQLDTFGGVGEEGSHLLLKKKKKTKTKQNNKLS